MPEGTAWLGPRLAEWAARLRYEDLPPTVVAKAKALLLDTLSVGWAGSGAEGMAEMHALVQAQGGAGESRVWAFGGSLPATQAAFLNGSMAAALDFDSVHDLAGAHSDGVVIPAVLALAERERLSGREFLAAYAAGSEILVRLSLAVRARPGWFYSSVLGVFGAAAGASRALRLDAAPACHAMGVALSRAAGTQQSLAERSLSKRLQTAFASRDGVDAALLAACGVTAPAQMFEGAAGFCALYGEIDAAVALEGLGREFHFTALTMKKYASCYCNHAAIQAAIDLVHRHGLCAADVREVAVRITPFMARLVGAPYAPGDNPQVSAQFSVQYSVASVLLRGRFALEDIMPAAAKDPEVCELASRVVIEIDGTQTGKYVPATVRVRTASGTTLEATATQLCGTPSNPMPEPELHAKALACLGTGVRPIRQDAARRLAARIASVDTVTDMRAFLAPTAIGDQRDSGYDPALDEKATIQESQGGI